MGSPDEEKKKGAPGGEHSCVKEVKSIVRVGELLGMVYTLCIHGPPAAPAAAVTQSPKVVEMIQDNGYQVVNAPLCLLQ